MWFRRHGEHSQRAQLALALFVAQFASCALPGVQRDKADAPPAGADRSDAGTDAGADAASKIGAIEPAGPVDGSDAGEAYDPEWDPANRNEDFATFQSLVPSEHLFAEWPMPDSSENSQTKPSYSATDLVVTDNVTKLRWQRKLPDTYPGCVGKYNFVGRDREVGSGCTWDEAKKYCARPELAEELGGGTWRLPTKIELESLLDTNRVNAIDPLLDTFPIDMIWTATPFPNPDGLKLAWAVDFMGGYSYDSARYKAGRVRCVSSPHEKGGAAPKYETSRGQTGVVDRYTGLTWQAHQDSQTRDWFEALAYCESLALDGGGWRVPYLKELLTLVDASRHLPAVDRRNFYLTANDRFWTASECLNERNMVYQVNFRQGGVEYGGTPADKHYVRCVR